MPPFQDIRHFHHRLEAMLATVGRTEASPAFAREVVPRVLSELGQFLGVSTAHLYEREADRVRLCEAWGPARDGLAGELPKRLASSGDGAITELPWVGDTERGPAGLFAIDGDETLLVAMFPHADAPDDTAARARLEYVLSTLDYALRQHLKRRQLEDVVEQARAIQLSLLPPGRPSFGDFDIAAASVPAQEVGGDLYDFLPLDDETLAIAVADASGHGLPAALQARDVAMGLRMGAERDLKITRIVEKLNRIIHRSGLSTRFVSLIFGELEVNGNFAYINAGHPPALLRDERGFHELSVGGLFLGPVANSLYKLGFAHLDRGGLLVLYSDGVVERGAESGRPFGAHRLREWMDDWREGPGDRAIAELLRRLKDYDLGRPLEDDVTVVYVRRPR